MDVMALGTYGDWYFTNNYYQTAEDKQLADEEQHNRDNVLCSTEVMRGKRGEVILTITYPMIPRRCGWGFKEQ